MTLCVLFENLKTQKSLNFEICVRIVDYVSVWMFLLQLFKLDKEVYRYCNEDKNVVYISKD